MYTRKSVQYTHSWGWLMPKGGVVLGDELERRLDRHRDVEACPFRGGAGLAVAAAEPARA
jgi:hypothetical protein